MLSVAIKPKSQADEDKLWFGYRFAKAAHEGQKRKSGEPFFTHAMTVATIVAGLIPIFIGEGTGSEVMRRIAAPMIGGMITAPLLSLFVIPVIYIMWKKRSIQPA